MEETFNIVSQEIYRTRQIDISNNPECKKLFRKIVNKYLDKYKKQKNDDIEACKQDIVNYSIKYFYKKVHGKPQGKVGDLKQYSNTKEPKDESTMPIPTERDIVDLKQQKSLFEKKDKIYRNLFSSDIRKVVFSVSTSQRTDLTSTTSFTIDIQDKNIADLKNVIGFNLLRAQIPNSRYSINDSNYQRLTEGDITRGDYTANSLATKLIADTSLLTATYSSSTGFFDFNADITTTGVTQADKSLARILGLKYNTNNYTTVGTKSVHKVDIRPNIFFDLEISEIPSIVCNNTEFSNNIVARIPVVGGSGNIENYTANPVDIITEYFQPQRLTKLTIRLLDEFGLEIDFNGVDSYFTFEAVILKNVPDMGIVLEN